MVKATDTPSARTRRLIRKAWLPGLVTHARVMVFCERTKQAVVAFNEEVKPLDLSDEDYDEVVRTSGMAHLLGLADRMGRLLAWASDEAA